MCEKMKMIELYQRFLKGEKFKSLQDINLGCLPVKKPVDLVGRSPIMQELAKKYSYNLKNK